MLAFPKPPSKAGEKSKAKRERDAYRRIIYRLVSKRDVTCRACHSKGPGLHHHHLKFRSKGGQDTEQNVLLLCNSCHSDVHGYRMTVVGDDARFTLRFVRAR